MYQNQVRRASFKQNWAFYVQLNPCSVKTLVLHLPYLKIHIEHFLCKTIPKKLKKIDVFKYSRRYGIYSKEILMQVIYSFVIINLNKNEHFLYNRIILSWKFYFLQIHTAKYLWKNWNKFNWISNKNVTNFTLKKS